MKDASLVLQHRLRQRPVGPLDIRTELHHFALISYAIPIDRLRPHIPADRFEIAEFDIGGERRALLSIVPFVDVDFHFRWLPFLRFRFAQTNHRVYVIDRASGEHAAWFFGTTLGSPVVHLARWLWRIPWHRGEYRIGCEYDAAERRYTAFEYDIRSEWCSARISVEDLGVEAGRLEGFASMEEMVLVLTHPVDGYFHRLDGAVGTYSVSHDVMRFTEARPKALYFSLYERLALLNREEMARPHSVLVAPRVTFDIHMPPRKVGSAEGRRP